MTRATLTDNHSRMVQAIKTMLQRQADYFAERKMGMPGTDKRKISIAAEVAARDLFKELHYNRPQIIEADIKDLVQPYNYFLDRCNALLTAQFYYFKDVHNRDLLRRCKALEKDMKEYIKKYNTSQHYQQQAALF